MSAFKLKTIPSTASRMDILPAEESGSRAIPPSAVRSKTKSNVRKSSFGAALRSNSATKAGDIQSSEMRRNSIAWETMSQTLALQVEQYRRSSELAASRRRSVAINKERQDQMKILIEDGKDVDEMASITIKNELPLHRPSAIGSISEFEEGKVGDTSLLRTDVHIVPIVNLVERFHTDLRNGLSNDTVTQHRAEYGSNKLTPPPKPSLVWMLLKQMLISFNGILWVATLFAFLSYVSLCAMKSSD